MNTTRIDQALHSPVRRAPVHPFAGVAAGLLAGVVYLALQMLLAGFLDSPDHWMPLKRIAAMLLGDDAVTDTRFNPDLIGIALLVHLTVSIVYGRLVDIVVRDAQPLRATLLGAAVGAAMYVVAFRVVAPLAFPWFADSPQVITLLDHLVFGSLAGLSYCLLRQRWERSAKLAQSVAPSD